MAYSSGTAALHAAYAAAGIGPGDEIVTTPITYAATGNAALLLGARPVFADIEPDTANLDAALAEAAIGERTKALVPVDFAGLPADIDVFREIADRRGLVLIQDAAHSLGATYKGKPVGNQADLTILSFHPVKTITTGEGGAVLTNDAALRDHLRLFRTHGVEKDPSKFEGAAHGPWHQQMQILGPNYRITDLQCALGRSQLRRIDDLVARRRKIAARYTEALADHPRFDLPAERDYGVSAWHLYPLRLRVDSIEEKARVFATLREAGLGVQVHYLPVYLHPYYARLGYQAGACPVAEAFYTRELSIPLYPAMDDATVERVIQTVGSLA